MEQKLIHAASELPETKLEFDAIQAAPTARKGKLLWRPKTAIAACLALVLCVGLGSYAYAAEVKEYNAAVQFFADYGLSTEGLTRGEIKAVYRDIITESFTYGKTTEVILSKTTVGGYEIDQLPPRFSPEELEKLWESLHQSPRSGHRYEQDSNYDYDENGHRYWIGSTIRKYDDDDSLLWSYTTDCFQIEKYQEVSDGVILVGSKEVSWSSAHINFAYIAKLNHNGQLQWERLFRNDFDLDREYIAKVVENSDGSYAVFSRGDSNYLCLSQYTSDGEQLLFQKTEVGNYGIKNAVRLGDGYLVQLFSYGEGMFAKLVKVDAEGNVTDSFTYSDEEHSYCIQDMIEYGGKVYLSTYAVPKPNVAGNFHEIQTIMEYIISQKSWEIRESELTELVRQNYTAILLVCEPDSGVPEKFYSVTGSLGGALKVDENGQLIWDVESIGSTFYSPVTSSFIIGGVSLVFRYCFDASGLLISQEATGETAAFRR